jgi:hypothetical protein
MWKAEKRIEDSEKTTKEDKQWVTNYHIQRWNVF